jgi:hypothetical protein
MTKRRLGHVVFIVIAVLVSAYAANSAAREGARVVQSSQSESPRTATTAEPSLGAWPPRTADGQPDIQSVWANAEQGIWTSWLEDTPYLVSIGLRGLGAETTGLPPGARRGTRRSAVIDPPDGILPYQPWALERRNSVMADWTKPKVWQMDTQTPGWPTGVPREKAYSSANGSYGGPIQILQPAGYVVFVFETHHEFQIVPLDGRPQPGQNIKLWEGSSRGRWEGNTLVVDVSNNNDSPRLSVIGDFHSDKMRATERWTFADKDTLDYRCTVDDPLVFTKPWTMSLTFKRTPPGTELMEYAGVEGDKNQADVLRPGARFRDSPK